MPSPHSCSRASRAGRLACRGWVAAAACALLAGTASADVDLLGTWYVLVHYRDSSTANPDADRWDDRVWKIEQKGSRLQWSEFPIVVFNDGSGRFGRVGANARARLLVAWEPNAKQMEEILQGLQVNSRGSKTKTLSGSPKRGYKSSSASRSTSALVVSYQETWSIDDPTGLPVFTRDDALGTEAALATKSDTAISGRTRYETREVSADGNRLTGVYSRDENRRGTFELIRSGAARGIETDGRTPNEKQTERIQQLIQEGVRENAYARFLQTLGNDAVRNLRAVLGEEKLSGIWQKYEQRIIADDAAARRELGAALRDAYVGALKQDVAKAITDGDVDALLGAETSPQAQGPVRAPGIQQVRDALGEARIAALREKYGARVEAGDAAARVALQKELWEAYGAATKDAFVQRLEAGDAEAKRQLEELQRE